MAKCVACTAINAELEAKRHPNSVAANWMSRSLAHRWNGTSKKFRHRYCPVHSDDGLGTPTLRDVRSKCIGGLELRINRAEESLLTANDVAKASLKEDLKQMKALRLRLTM